MCGTMVEEALHSSDKFARETSINMNLPRYMCSYNMNLPGKLDAMLHIQAPHPRVHLAQLSAARCVRSMPRH